MAMADLATNSSGEPITLSEVADRQLISLSYLEQLFGKLRRSGIVKSVRGPGGGYSLAHPLDQIRISDIILAVDEPITAQRCQAGSTTGCQASGSRCITHDLWAELTNHIYLFLNSVTLDDVISNRILGLSGALFQRDALAEMSNFQTTDDERPTQARAS